MGGFEAGLGIQNDVVLEMNLFMLENNSFVLETSPFMRETTGCLLDLSNFHDLPGKAPGTKALPTTIHKIKFISPNSCHKYPFSTAVR
jgi:hypothetical protein